VLEYPEYHALRGADRRDSDLAHDLPLEDVAP